MTAGRSRLLAHLLAGFALVLEMLALLLLIPQLRSGDVYLDENTIGGFVLGATFPVVGWLIATRRPGNAMGWIFIVIGLSQALDTFAGQYSYVGLVTAPGSLPAADVLAWVAVWAWVPGFAPLVTLAVLLFPDGRPPSPRWRPVIPLVGFAMLLLAIPVAIVAWPARGADLLGEGPVPSTDPTIGALLGLQLVGLIVVAIASLLSVLGMLTRFRRSRDVERAQLKWFVTAAVIEVGLLVMSGFVTLPSDLSGALLTIVVTPLLPIAATVAILRYRLYDIDRIISRTIGWAVVTGTLVVVFVVAVIAFEALLSSFAQQQTIAVAASTLVAFGVFQPVRRRIQSAVDRRFDRRRANAEASTAGLIARLRDEIDLETVANDVVGVVDEAVRPRGAALWLRGGSR